MKFLVSCLLFLNSFVCFAQENSLNKGLIVFMGDSITEGWTSVDSVFFQQNNYVNQGIGGHTTTHMLNRFFNDVISLKPEAVIILGGTNDLSGKLEEINPEKTKNNLKLMAEMADKQGIKVILCSILPVYEFPNKVKPSKNIESLNNWIKDFSDQNEFEYVDYYSKMVDEKKGLKKSYSEDGIHPNAHGYSVMKPILEKGIAEVLNN